MSGDFERGLLVQIGDFACQERVEGAGTEETRMRRGCSPFLNDLDNVQDDGADRDAEKKADGSDRRVKQKLFGCVRGSSFCVRRASQEEDDEDDCV